MASLTEWPQEERLTGMVVPDHNEWLYPGFCTHVALPGGEQIEPLIWGRERTAVLEAPPERLRRAHVMQDLKARDIAGDALARAREMLSARVVTDGDIHPVCSARPASTPIHRSSGEGGKQLSIKNWDIRRLSIPG